MRSISSSSGGSRAALEEPVLGRPGSGAWVLLLLALLLATGGAVTVHSASSEMPVDYLPRQLVWITLGIGAALVGAALDYRLLLRFAPPLYVLSLAAVLLVTLFGKEAGGARSWVGIAGLGGQPTDMAKLATVLLLARYLSGVRPTVLSLRQLGIAAAVVALPMVLVGFQPDLGGAVMFLPILAGMVMVCGVRLRIIAVLLLVVSAGAAGLWTYGMKPYQRDRILSFVEPERDPLGAGYQLRQSKIAVGSGQVFGRGYLQGTQSQLRFLPARHTDFIFAVLAEERGFLGVLLVLALYAVFFALGVRAASRARDRGGILIVIGLLSALSMHVLYNSAMMIGLVPVTGIPLPFLSYGGSFTLFCFFATGLIAGVDLRRYVNR